MSLKSKEEGSEFSNYSSQNYSNYSHCIILILRCIFLQVLMYAEDLLAYVHLSVFVCVRQVL